MTPSVMPAKRSGSRNPRAGFPPAGVELSYQEVTFMVSGRVRSLLRLDVGKDPLSQHDAPTICLLAASHSRSLCPHRLSLMQFLGDTAA